MADRKLPVVLDWDGTLVQDGEWMEGGREFLRFCKRRWPVVIHSARAGFPQGMAEIRTMLDEAGYRDIKVFPKPWGFAYVDDLAVPHKGSYVETRERVRQLA